jgi:hypothetical protein
MMRKLAAICADVGVEIVPTTRMPGPGQTTARSTLQRILRDHGEGHLIQLLRTFVETENSVGARIDAFAIFAVNDIILAHPEWASSGLRWLEVFDRIDLGEIQRVAKANRDAVPPAPGHRHHAVSRTQRGLRRKSPHRNRGDQRRAD